VARKSPRTSRTGAIAPEAQEVAATGDKRNRVAPSTPRPVCLVAALGARRSRRGCRWLYASGCSTRAAVLRERLIPTEALCLAFSRRPATAMGQRATPGLLGSPRRMRCEIYILRSSAAADGRASSSVARCTPAAPGLSVMPAGIPREQPSARCADAGRTNASLSDIPATSPSGSLLQHGRRVYLAAAVSASRAGVAPRSHGAAAFA
jgi:hypothetical protein